MKVLHVCICGPFTDELAYQENELIAQHVGLGHDVTVIAATDTYDSDKQLIHAKAGTMQLSCGAKPTCAASALFHHVSRFADAP